MDEVVTVTPAASEMNSTKLSDSRGVAPQFAAPLDRHYVRPLYSTSTTRRFSAGGTSASYTPRSLSTR
jgi:hypothetical protein